MNRASIAIQNEINNNNKQQTTNNKAIGNIETQTGEQNA